MSKLGLAILFGLILAYTFSSAAAAQDPLKVTIQNQGGADDADIQKAIKDAHGQPIIISLLPRTEVGCYSISGPIDLASNVTIDSTSPPDRWCMQRATPPRTENSPELRWFSVTGAAVDNFTMRNANLYGLGPGGVSFEEQTSYIDRGLVFTQRMRDPENLSLYSNNLTLEHVTFDKFYGVCVFLQYVNGLSFDDVVCNDPTKGGLIFSFGSRNGIIKHSVSTLTGDDAMAFNSGTDTPGGALVTNFEVSKTHLTQEQDDQGCGTLCFRGATNIVITESDVGAGSGVGAIGIRNSKDAASQWSSSNIEVSSTIIRPDEGENGVYVNDPGATDIRITNNDPIAYTPPNCGILLSERTPVPEVTISGNRFKPHEPSTNVCYPTTFTPTENSVLGLGWLRSVAKSGAPARK